ncbi:hypothetical protein BGX29_003333 [Mortierella sp. GBA35]|nr:hypothetical protein BGX29_003333 [Mortierella sp. GBA35]
MPMTLKDIEDYERKDMLRVEHIHWAITNEVRDLKNWDNALTLLTSYLAPVIIASEKAAAAAVTTPTGDNTNTNPNTNTTTNSTNGKKATAAENNNTHSSPPTTDGPGAAGGGGAHGKTFSSKFSEFVEDETTGQFTKQLTEQDIRLIQWSMAALVRYAPTPSESNVVYMFYLQRQPPLRNDETIDNCLISLIYQYAQVKDDRELQAKGLDLIKVALERGIGLASFQSRTSVKNQTYRPQRETILASVSKPILIQQSLQITQDGRALEPRRPGQNQGRPPPTQQKPGAYPPQKASGGVSTGQRQGLGLSQGQWQSHQGQGQGQVVSGRGSGRPAAVAAAAAAAGSSPPHPQPSSQPQQTQSPQQVQSHSQAQGGRSQTQTDNTQPQSPTQGKTKPRHRKQDNNNAANQDTQESSNTAAPRAEEPVDQYDYYTRASRSFAGTERTKSGGRSSFGGVGGSSGGKLRTIAFVPASTNPMLKTDHPAPSTDDGDHEGQHTGDDVDKEKGSKEDATVVLAEGIEKLRLDPTSD